MNAICILAIPHAEQRYDTVGDWFFSDGGLEIRVSELSDDRYECLLALHELIEALLCKASGVTEVDVTLFDLKWQGGDRDRHSTVTGEPGDDHRAPYHRQHRTASLIEMAVAHELGVRWEDYEKALDELS